eukprot:11833910-Karenia_brevis.AAC.1
MGAPPKAGPGPTGATRGLQGVGPPPRATSGVPFNQVELGNVVQHFLGTLPQGSPQGHGSHWFPKQAIMPCRG